MKNTWPGVAVVGTALLVAQVTVSAHHSFAAEFDAKKSTTLTGTVVSIKWTNPHAHIFVDVKDQTGNLASWDFEMGSPNALMRRGWSRSSLKPGDTITVNGYLAKDGSHLANARTVTLSDGRNVFAGSSLETAQTQ
ncbi:MAG TPA: DUF6152 family protein [Candidatus Acidoferrum sp.]|nr:DUF6152 family protein [Candidatus Acidoferrum sp.]